MEYNIQKVEEAPPFSGIPEGGGWEKAEKRALRDTVTGESPLLATHFRMLYSSEFLYTGFVVEDNAILASFTDHDYPLYREDVVELFISPSGSLNYYYEFNFSPKEVVCDAIVLNSGGASLTGRGEVFIPLLAWDCEGLRIRAHRREDKNWSVTVQIPFSRLHLAGNRAPEPGDTWRGNLFRIEYGGTEVEYSAWSPTGMKDFHIAGTFGTFNFT